MGSKLVIYLSNIDVINKINKPEEYYLNALIEAIIKDLKKIGFTQTLLFSFILVFCLSTGISYVEFIMVIVGFVIPIVILSLPSIMNILEINTKKYLLLIMKKQKD